MGVVHDAVDDSGSHGFVLPSKGCPVFMLVDVFCHCPKLFCGKYTNHSPHICGICFAFSPQKWQIENWSVSFHLPNNPIQVKNYFGKHANR